VKIQGLIIFLCEYSDAFLVQGISKLRDPFPTSKLLVLELGKGLLYLKHPVFKYDMQELIKKN